MATIASLIVNIGADLSSLIRNVEDGNRHLDDINEHMTESVFKGSLLADAFEKVGEVGLEAFEKLLEVVPKLTEALVEMGIKGSEIEDVRLGFERLAGGAENATAMLNAMRAGTVGTISDLQLMTDANHLLAVGAVKSADDLGTMTEAARVLAREFAGNMQDSMEAVSKAMETGRVKRLALAGVTVDTKGAEEAFAESMNTTANRLSALGKLTADREAVLTSLKGVIADAGDQELTFAERIHQVETAWTNFKDALSVAVATSPVVTLALKTIGDTMTGALGANKVEIIQTLIQWVNQFAIALVSAAEYAITAAQGIVKGWGLMKAEVIDVVAMITEGAVLAMRAWAGVETMTGDIGKGVIVNQAADALKTLQQGLENNAELTRSAALSQSDFDRAANSTKDTLEGLRQKMIDAAAQGVSNEAVVKALGKAHEQTGSMINNHAEKLDPLSKAYDQLANQLSALDARFSGIDQGWQRMDDGTMQMVVDLPLLSKAIEESGKQIYDLVTKADEMGVAVPDALRAVADGWNASEIFKVMAKTGDQWMKDLAVYINKIEAELEKHNNVITKDNERAAVETNTLWREQADLESQLTQTSTQYRITKIWEWEAAQELAFKGSADQWGAFYDNLQAVTQDKVALIAQSQDPIWKAWQGLNANMQQTWADTWTKAIDGTGSFVDALTSPWKQIEQGWTKLLGAMVADWEQQFIQQLTGVNISHSMGSAMGVGGGSTSPGFGVSSGTGGFSLAGLFGGSSTTGMVKGSSIDAAGNITEPTYQSNAANYAALSAIGAGLLAAATSKQENKTEQIVNYSAQGAEYGAVAAPYTFGISIGVGAAIGAIVGALKVNPQETMADTSRNTFMAAMSGVPGMTADKLDAAATDKAIQAIGDAYGQLGISAQKAQADIKALFNANDPTLYAAALKPVTDNLQKIKDIASAFSGVDTAAKSFTGVLTPAIQTVIDHLLTMKGLSSDEITTLQNLEKSGVPSIDSLMKTAQQYGLTLDDLGPKVEQMSISKTADQILNDFQSLENAGADYGGLINHFSGSINTLVNNALKYGSSLPTALQPILDHMIVAGELTDDTGKKIKDLAGLHFDDTNDPLAQSSDKLIQALTHLTDILANLPSNALTAAGGVAGALDKIPKDVTSTIHYKYDQGQPPAPPGPSPTPPPKDPAPSDPAPQSPVTEGYYRADGGWQYTGPIHHEALGGFGTVTGPTMFLAGEAGAEEFAFSGGGRSFGVSGTGGGPMTVNITITNPVMNDIASRAALARVVEDEFVRELNFRSKAAG